VTDYEIFVIFDPLLPEERILEDVEKLKALIAEYKGEITKTDIWGKRKLAYQMKKKREGFYVLLNYTIATGGGALVEELNRRLRIAENVLRHMVVKMPLLKPVEKKEEVATEQPAETAGAQPAEGSAAAAEVEDGEQEQTASEQQDAAQEPAGST
jgi:small subunit ribosomal protein S6